MLKMAFWQKSGCLIDHISRALLLFHRGNQELMGKGFPGGSVVKNLLAHAGDGDRKSTRLNSSHSGQSRMPSSA